MGLFGANTGFNAALIRIEEWLGADAEEMARRFAKAVRLSAAPLLIAICPATEQQAAACAPVEAWLRMALEAESFGAFPRAGSGGERA